MDDFGSQNTGAGGNSGSRLAKGLIRFLLVPAIVLVGVIPAWMYFDASLSDKALAKYQWGWLIPVILTAVLAIVQMLASDWIVSSGWKKTSGGEWFAVGGALVLSGLNVLAGLKGITGLTSGDSAAVLIAITAFYIVSYWPILQHFFKFRLVSVW